MNRTKQRLKVQTSKESANTDTYLKIGIDGTEKLLPPDEMNRVVNVGDRFNTERQRSKTYRVLGSINPTISNALFNLDDTPNGDLYTWAGFNYRDTAGQYRFLDRSYPKDANLSDENDLNYKQGLGEFLKEVDGWFGYYNPDKIQSGFCEYFDMEPKRERFTFTPDITPYNNPNGAPVNNWEVTLTYPKLTDKTHPMVSGGLLLLDYKPVVVATRNMVAFGTATLHNLSAGEVVKLTGTTGFDGEHVVVRVGLDNGDLKGYYFVIDVAPTTGSSPINQNSRMKRVFGGQESEYYFRIFTKIKTVNNPIIEQDDYEMYKLGFSENIYNDSLAQYVFNEDIDISGLTDNLGRPVSEMFLTLVKTNSNNVFTNVTSGIDTPFISELNNTTKPYLKLIPAIDKIHNGGNLPFPSHTPLEINVINNNNVHNFYGDIVEYNMFEVKETVLGDVHHRFNTNNRETQANFTYVSNIGVTPVTKNIDLGPRREGYKYKAHHRLQVRQYSSYIEQGDVTTEGIPDYAVNLGDGRYLWRDLLDIGINENDVTPLDYPFLNGSHYLYNNHCFTVKRQDPFNNWGLYYGKFPADPIGNPITDNFTINESDDPC